MFIRQSSSRLDWASFGSALISSEDLDPIYCMVKNYAWPDTELLARWLVAYWCFYHAGVASYIAESDDFYGVMEEACRENWPRASERRHFRGQAALNAIACLKREGDPAQLVGKLCKSPHTFESVSDRIQSWEQFGPWITFKIADMLERILDIPILFDHEHTTFIYQEPVAGAKLIHQIQGWNFPFGVRTFDEIHQCFAKYMAPPQYNRLCNLQEVETICCKFKSYHKGHYYVGKDCHEIARALVGWGPLANALAPHVPHVDPGDYE